MWVGRRRPESAPPPCSQTATHWPSIAASSAAAPRRVGLAALAQPAEEASSSSTSSWKHQRTDAPTSSGSSSPFFFFFSFPFFLRPSSACAAASSCSCCTTRVACSMHDGCIPSSWPSSVARIGGGVPIPHATRSSASQGSPSSAASRARRRRTRGRRRRRTGRRPPPASRRREGEGEAEEVRVVEPQRELLAVELGEHPHRADAARLQAHPRELERRAQVLDVARLPRRGARRGRATTRSPPRRRRWRRSPR